MRNLGHVSHNQSLITKEQLDNKKSIVISETPPNDKGVIWVHPNSVNVENNNIQPLASEQYVQEANAQLKSEILSEMTNVGDMDNIGKIKVGNEFLTVLIVERGKVPTDTTGLIVFEKD